MKKLYFVVMTDDNNITVKIPCDTMRKCLMLVKFYRPMKSVKFVAWTME